MHIGLGINNPSYLVDVAAIARKAEELGFESLWYAEHAVVPVHLQARHEDSPSPSFGAAEAVPGYAPFAHFGDPFVSLARASGVTRTIRLGTAICLVAERNPLLLAKEVATLDLYSGGRFLLGVGAGWIREESEIMGGDFAHRWTQVAEAVQAMKALWTRDDAEFHGRYYSFPPVGPIPSLSRSPIRLS